MLLLIAYNPFAENEVKHLIAGSIVLTNLRKFRRQCLVSFPISGLKRFYFNLNSSSVLMRRGRKSRRNFVGQIKPIRLIQEHSTYDEISWVTLSCTTVNFHHASQGGTSYCSFMTSACFRMLGRRSSMFRCGKWNYFLSVSSCFSLLIAACCSAGHALLTFSSKHFQNN